MVSITIVAGTISSYNIFTRTIDIVCYEQIKSHVRQYCEICNMVKNVASQTKPAGSNRIIRIEFLIWNGTARNFICL